MYLFYKFKFDNFISNYSKKKTQIYDNYFFTWSGKTNLESLKIIIDNLNLNDKISNILFETTINFSSLYFDVYKNKITTLSDNNLKKSDLYHHVEFIIDKYPNFMFNICKTSKIKYYDDKSLELILKKERYLEINVDELRDSVAQNKIRISSIIILNNYVVLNTTVTLNLIFINNILIKIDRITILNYTYKHDH
jgi:hypothetical protein